MAKKTDEQNSSDFLRPYSQPRTGAGDRGFRCAKRKCNDDLSLYHYPCLHFLNRSPTHFLQMSYLSKTHGFRRGSSGPTKKRVGFNSLFCWRRERDSDPRTVSRQRFSRPPHSTALPSLHGKRTRNVFFLLFIRFLPFICVCRGRTAPACRLPNACRSRFQHSANRSCACRTLRAAI